MREPTTAEGPEPGCPACDAAVQKRWRSGITYADCPGCAAREIANGITAWRVLVEKYGAHELAQVIWDAFPPDQRAIARKKVWHWWGMFRHPQPPAAIPAPLPTTEATEDA